MAEHPRIHLSPPAVSEREIDAVVAAIRSGWVAPVGPDLDAFERDLAIAAGTRCAVGLVSGTAALHLALHSLGVGAGDEVLVSTLTFVATANAVVYTGARPVFVDADPATWCVAPALLHDELQRRRRANRLPKAVVVVDLYGQCADYDEIMPLCRELAVPVVEDAAEALGATYRQRRAGSLGDVGVLSFNGNKIVTTSGGGALVCDDEALAMRIRHLSTQARVPAPHYEHVELGFNYRLSNILAALGRAQLEQLADKVETRRATNRRYRDLLAKVPGVEFMPDAPYGRPTNWLTCITLDPAQAPFTRDELIRHLADYNIESRPTWMPMHLQPQYRDAHCVGGSVAETIFRTGVCLPMVPARAEDRARIERALRDLIDAKHA